jgi:hypothetical protein
MTLLRMGRALCLAMVMLLSGAALAGDRVEPGTGLAYGAFDISDSEVGVTHAVLMRIKPARMYMGSSGERDTVTFTNGEFYSANLAPGTYALMGFFSGNVFFALEKSLRQNTFQIEPGRATYAGSYKLIVKKGGMFRRDKGTFERIDSPQEEARVQQWLTKELGNSGWATAVRARMGEKK